MFVCASFQNYEQNPWLLHLAAKLLVNDKETLSLISVNPFNSTSPPYFIKMDHYKYQYSKWGSKEAKNGAWWTRTKIGSYLPPVNMDSLKPTLRQMGWKTPKRPKVKTTTKS